MQRLLKIGVSASDYIKNELCLLVRAPWCCPNCGKAGKLRALGYYERNVSEQESGEVKRIRVRRFLCGSCERSLSLLPSFCHPYRLVCHQRQSDYFVNENQNRATQVWEGLLKRYGKRFKYWLEELKRTLGGAYGPSPPLEAETVTWWTFLQDSFGSLGDCTRILVEKFHVTVFNRYQCHQVNNQGI